MMRIQRVPALVIAALALIGGASRIAKADTPNACFPVEDMLEAHAYLRAASLDLRGTLPSAEEIDGVDSASDPLAQVRATASSWLGSDAFLERIVRHHRDLFWDNITNQPLIAVLWNIGAVSVPLEDGTTTKKAIWIRSNQMSILYRGIFDGPTGVGPKLTAQIPCLAIPQADLNAMSDEQIKTKWGSAVTYGMRDGNRYINVKNPLSAADINVDTLYHREGYVDVHPFWAPDTTIQVCAFDAQTGELGDDGITRCGDATVGASNLGCGCGQDLRYCGTGQTAQTILTAFTNSLERSIRDVMKPGGNYYDLFLSTKIWVNGPIAYLYKYQTGSYNRLALTPVPIPQNPDDIADFTKTDTWALVDAGPAAAGVLTNPGYLLRFQTLRARANRFYDKFLCQPFQAPAQGLPSPDDPCSAEPDLQKRCGCEYCHVTLEPASVHWGRWAMNGSGFLNPTDYPPSRSDCSACAAGTGPCSTQCRAQYHITPVMAHDPYLGMLNAYAFISTENQANIEQGPKLLVQSMLTDGSLQECTVRRTFTWLIGRDAANDTDEQYIAYLTDQFQKSGYDYMALVETIVGDDNYRSMK